MQKIPKKALKKIDKTIEELKVKLISIRKRDIVKSRILRDEKKKRKQRAKIRDRNLRRKNQAQTSMRKEERKDSREEIEFEFLKH